MNKGAAQGYNCVGRHRLVLGDMGPQRPRKITRPGHAGLDVWVV
jgi:hypothetical protein